MNNPQELSADVRRLRERLRELEAYRDQVRLAPQTLRIGPSLDEAATALQVGDFWPVRFHPAWIIATFAVPSDWSSASELCADLGGEGCWVDEGQARFGFNPLHRSAVVEVKPGCEQTFAFEVVPHGYQGAPVHEPRVHACQLVVPDPDVRKLWFDLDVALDVLSFLAQRQDVEVGYRLRQCIERALRALRLPREPTESYLARMAWLDAKPVEGGSTDSPALQVRSSLWERPVFDASPLSLDDGARQRIRDANAAFVEECRALQRRYPGRGRLTLLGHAHLDVAWLWPISETRNKSRRTFATACALADRYPNYVFAQSQAYLYAAVEEDDPALFSRIQELASAGRIELLGGSWVEPDGNLASGESTVRQLLYGQRYFESRFGRRCTVAWLPDTFGYAGNLPQLYADAGMKYFVTTKLNWNETNQFPHDLYWWEGLDGTRVLAHTFVDIGPGADPQIMSDAWEKYRAKVRADVTLQTFGRGDGGGGPSEAMLEGFARLAKHPVLPAMSFGKAADVFEELQEVQDIPVWKGEKYLEKHRGTFTTQVAVKRDVQRLAEVLRETEALWTVAWTEEGCEYPATELQRLWKIQLVHEFHDILPGSSIHAVNEEAKASLAGALIDAEALAQEGLAKLTHPSDDAITIWNVAETDVPLAGRLSLPNGHALAVDGSLIAADGTEVRVQRVGDAFALSSKYVVRPGESVELRAAAASASPKDGVAASATTLRSNVLEVDLSADGTIGALRSVASGRSFVQAGAGKLVLFEDVPKEYEAWDIEREDLRHGTPLDVLGAPEVLYQGPVEAAVMFQMEGPGVRVELTYRLQYDASRLDVHAEIDWRARRRLLRLELPTTIVSDSARFDTLFGSVNRPTHQNTSWDAAKYEVPAHRGVALEDARGGVQLIAPHGRHGFSVDGQTISLSLLRGPIHPDPQADVGKHTFDWSIEVADERKLLAPVRQILRAASGAAADALSNRPWFSAPGVRCAALKKSEDGDAVILRLYEAEGACRTVRVALPNWVKSVQLCTLLEDQGQRAEVQQSEDGETFVEVSFQAYAVRTLRLEK